MLRSFSRVLFAHVVLAKGPPCHEVAVVIDGARDAICFPTSLDDPARIAAHAARSVATLCGRQRGAGEAVVSECGRAARAIARPHLSLIHI